MNSMKYIAGIYTAMHVINYKGYLTNVLYKWCLNTWGDDISALHRWLLKACNMPVETQSLL